MLQKEEKEPVQPLIIIALINHHHQENLNIILNHYSQLLGPNSVCSEHVMMRTMLLIDTQKYFKARKVNST